MDTRYLGDGRLETQDLMAQEGRRIVDAARGRGVVLRLLGGLAVHEYCAGFSACRRDHLDLDLAGLRRQTGSVIEVLGEFGYEERTQVRLATAAGQAQFVRDCVHGDADGVRAHARGSRGRLLRPLQARPRHRPPRAAGAASVRGPAHGHPRGEAADARTLRPATFATCSCCSRRRPRRAPLPGDVDPDYLGTLCAHDWGLFHDVSRNLQRCGEALQDADLDDADRQRVTQYLARLTGAIDAAPKSVAWRLRARVGTRLSWWDVVEEQETAA